MSDFILVQNRPLSGAKNSVGPKWQSNNVEMRESVREINNENREFMTAASTGITVSSFNKQRGKKKSAFIDQRSAMNKKHQKSRKSNSTPSIFNSIFTSCTLRSEAVFLSHKCHVTDHYISTLCSREKNRYFSPLLKACQKDRISNTIHWFFLSFYIQFISEYIAVFMFNNDFLSQNCDINSQFWEIKSELQDINSWELEQL